MSNGEARTTAEVARDHLDAVETGDAAAMAADYSSDASLQRGTDLHEGREAIEAYFRTVPDRLGEANVVFDELVVEGDTATFRWHLEGGATASGTDVVVIEHGLIVSQVVHLHASDF